MHRSCPPTAAQGSQQQSMLELLPTELLPVIAKDCLLGDPGSNGHRMLGVCRACRQAVLSCLKNAKLGLDEDSSIQPLARLLHRICSQASPGLGVELDLVEQHRALPLLIQPGLQCGGWSNVTALKVRAKSSAVACQVRVRASSRGHCCAATVTQCLHFTTCGTE
jgi:hypothetical protein